jgi:hypothetical protein
MSYIFQPTNQPDEWSYRVIGFGRVTYIIDSSKAEPKYSDEEINEFANTEITLL